MARSFQRLWHLSATASGSGPKAGLWKSPSLQASSPYLPSPSCLHKSGYLDARSTIIVRHSYPYSTSTTSTATTTTTTITPARVRFAPSPTGHLHLGGLRTALYNYLLAKQTGGSCILRIEDTDQTRFVPEAKESLIRSLKWAGVEFDEGPSGIGGPHSPYIQSKRLDIYKKEAEKLVECGHAYRCFCTPERLSLVRLEAQKSGRMGASYDRKCLSISKEDQEQMVKDGVPFVIRMKVPEGSTVVQDQVHGKVEFDNKEVDDTVLMKSDGFPTYHLANVVDDHLMEITHVIRGQEWLPSAPKHVMLYNMFGWQVPQFAHVPLLLNPDKSKLSKRSGDVNVEEYMKRGYFPEAVCNFVALLGWHPGTTEEIFDMKGLIKAFSLDHIQQSNAVVLREKLDWINKSHLLLKAESTAGLMEMAITLRPTLERDLGLRSLDFTDEYTATVIDTLKSRIKNLYDVPKLCSYFYKDPDYNAETSQVYRNMIGDATLHSILPIVLRALEEAFHSSSWNVDTLKAVVKNIAKQKGIPKSYVMNALRYSISGVQVGAGLPETLVTLGPLTSIERVKTIIEEVHQS